jgi:hypothetical protein
VSGIVAIGRRRSSATDSAPASIDYDVMIVRREEMHMSKARRRSIKQHYVPQCYLRQWAQQYRNGHQLSVFDRRCKKSYKNNVKDVCCQNYFNRINVDGMDHEALEKALSEFETKLAEALVRINGAKTLENEDDKACLITLIGLTALRSPAMREQIRRLHQDIARMNIAERLKTKDAYEADVAKAKEQGALPADYDVSYDEMKAAFESGKYKLKLDQNYQVSLELMLLDHILPLLFRRGWVLVRAPEGSGGFITSDSPFHLTFSNSAHRQGDIMPGLAMNGTDVYFPISPTLAVVGAFNLRNAVDDADDAHVAMLNSAMVAGAVQQVYSRNHGFSYTRGVGDPVRTGNQLISDKRFR